MITIDPPSSSLALSELKTISAAGLSRFLTRARQAVELAGSVDVLLTSDAAVKRLNRAFRGKNKATDVLSFPAPTELAGEVAGDLAVSLDTAARQALEHGHSLAEEVRVLLLHGLLHLAGEDHEVDEGEMAAREQALRRALKLPVGLIERVEAGVGLAVRGAQEKQQIPRLRSGMTTRTSAALKKGVRAQPKAAKKSVGRKIAAKQAVRAKPVAEKMKERRDGAR